MVGLTASVMELSVVEDIAKTFVKQYNDVFAVFNPHGARSGTTAQILPLL